VGNGDGAPRKDKKTTMTEPAERQLDMNCFRGVLRADKRHAHPKPEKQREKSGFFRGRKPKSRRRTSREKGEEAKVPRAPGQNRGGSDEVGWTGLRAVIRGHRERNQKKGGGKMKTNERGEKHENLKTN